MTEEGEIICQGYDISRSAAIICTHVVSGKFPILSAVRNESVDPADRGGKKSQKLGSSDEIRDETLLPGFVLPLAKVFRLP